MNKIIIIFLLMPVLSFAQVKRNFVFEAGIGYDMQKIHFDYKRDRPWVMKARSLVTEENLPVYLTPPIYIGAKYQRKMSKRWLFETGLELFYRQIWFQRSTVNLDGKIQNTGVRFAPMVIPLHFNYRRKIGKFDWIGSIGLSLEFTRLFHRDNSTYYYGPASYEPKGSAKVVEITKGEYNMFYLDNSEGMDNLDASIELLISKKQSIKLMYRQQIEASYQLQIWGYDKANDTRVGGYDPNPFKFKTITLSYRYYLRNVK